MRPSGRNEGHTAVIVNKYSKSSSCNDGEEYDEQVEDHVVANDEAIKIPMENGESTIFYPNTVKNRPM